MLLRQIFDVRRVKANVTGVVCAGGMALILFIVIYCRPWYAPTKVIFDDVPLGTEITLHLKNSWGEDLTKKVVVERVKQQLHMGAVHLQSIEAKTIAPVRMTMNLGGAEFSNSFKEKWSDLPVPATQRNSGRLIVMMVMFSTVIFLGLWLTWEYVHQVGRQQLQSHWWGFAGLVVVFFLSVYLLRPGFMSWDITAQLLSASRYETSAFTGLFYSAMTIPLFQLIPRFWTVTAGNIIVLLMCLMHIYFFSARHGRLLIFSALSIIFFLYPSNFVLTFYPGRDAMSGWVFTLALLKLFEMKIDRDYSWNSMAWLSFFVFLGSLLRQEGIWLLVPAVTILFWKDLKVDAQKSTTTLGTSVIMILFFNVIDQPTFKHDVYQTTLLINPLSSILKKKHPTGLPPEINQSLGSYFRNDYLILHHSELDIDPFHHLGVKNETAPHEQYLQFRNAAIKIILDNPVEWIENRLAVNKKTMMGSGHMFAEYQLKIGLTDKQKDMMWNLPMKHDSPPQLMATELVLKLQGFREIIMKSYVLPLIFWMISIFYTRSKIFWGLSAVIFLRYVLVFITAPAAYYKYQYPIWIFGCFSLLYVLIERRVESTRVAGTQFKDGDVSNSIR